MADESPEKRPGRVRSAIAVLRGQALVPDQILYEWVEYQQVFGDLVKQFSALLARQAKADKKRARELLEAAAPSPEQSPAARGVRNRSTRKAELRSRAAALRGFPARPLQVANGKDEPHHQHTPEEDP